jgi:hypothetical protein
MKFNKADYKQEKAKVVELIKNSHDWLKTEGFIADGIINPDIYEKEKLKILVILAETYGYDGEEETNIEDQQYKDIMGLSSHTVKSPRKVATLLWLLLKSIEKGSKIPFSDFEKLELFKINDQNDNELHKILLKVAWINVKKASNPEAVQDYDKVYRDAIKNKEIIIRQVESISPDLIIVCSKVVIRSIYEMGILGTGTNDERYKIQKNKIGQNIINVNHPRYAADWGYRGVYEIFELIHDNLNL